MAFPHRFGIHQMPGAPGFMTISQFAPVHHVPMVPMVQTTVSYAMPVLPGGVLTSVGAKQLKKKGPPVETYPTTTVFVGNITEKVSNDLIKQMLLRCGNVVNWKRIQGSNGKYQAFGFCEYDHPESTLKALRMLHDWPLGDKKLVVKADDKTKKELRDFVIKRRKAQGKKPPADCDELTLDEEETRDDETIKRDLIALVREYYPDGAIEEGEIPAGGSAYVLKRGNLAQTTMDAQRREYIEREINFFRETYKDDKDTIKRAKTRPGDEDHREDNNSSPPMGDSESGRLSIDQRSLSSPRNRSRSHGHGGDYSPVRHRHKRSPSPTPSPVRSRSRDQRRYSESKERSDSGSEDEEDVERRRLEKKLREKEAGYQERLRKWEARERKKSREYEKETQRKRKKRADEKKEAKKLREFLEDYDDERDDPKYYKANALAARRKDFEKEKELDGRDRLKEKEELEEIKQKLISEGIRNPEEEIKRLQEKEEETLKEKMRGSDDESRSPSPERMEEEPTCSPKDSIKDDDEPQEKSSRGFTESSFKPAGEIEPTPITSNPAKPMGFAGIKLGSQAASSNHSLREVFNDEDDDGSGLKSKRKLIPLEYTDEEKQAVNQPTHPLSADEKKKLIKNLIERIPTARDELFQYPVNWSLVDKGLIEKRLKPWVNKKIIEYIGEEEASLVDFICQKVTNKADPQSVLDDVTMVLDEEAEVFVVKMWRLLIYEIEAKKAGLVKPEPT